MATTPFVSYDVGATPQDTFVVPYQFWEETDLDILFNGIEVSDFHAPVLPSPAGGEIILASPVSDGTLTIQRYTETERYTVFPIAGPFRIEALNNEFDRSLAMIDDRVFVSENNQVTWDEVVNKPDVVVWDELYPINSVYISFSNNPPSRGTWALIASGTFLVSAGGGLSPDDTGGEATHVLTAAELPAHNHSVSVAIESDGAHTHTVNDSYVSSAGSGIESGGEYSQASLTKTTTSDGAHIHTATVTEGNIGSGAAHNNMPPYIAVNMWRRTA